MSPQRRKEHCHFEIGGVEWRNCSETADSLIPAQLWSAQVSKCFSLPFLQTRHMPLVAPAFVFMIRGIRKWERRKEATSLCRWTEYTRDTPLTFGSISHRGISVQMQKQPWASATKKKNKCSSLCSPAQYSQEQVFHSTNPTKLGSAQTTASFYLDHCVWLAQELTELCKTFLTVLQISLCSIH